MRAGIPASALDATLSMLRGWLGLGPEVAGSYAPWLDAFTGALAGQRFTLYIPIDAVPALLAGAQQRRLLAVSEAAAAAAAASLTSLVHAKCKDGSLALAMAQSGVAASLGYASTADAMAALVVLPAVVAAQQPSSTPSAASAQGSSSGGVVAGIAVGAVAAAALAAAAVALGLRRHWGAKVARAAVAQGGAAQCASGANGIPPQDALEVRNAYGEAQ